MLVSVTIHLQLCEAHFNYLHVLMSYLENIFSGCRYLDVHMLLVSVTVHPFSGCRYLDVHVLLVSVTIHIRINMHIFG